MKERVVVCSLEGALHDGNAVEVAGRLARLARARLALVAVVPLPAAVRDTSPAWTAEEAIDALELTAAAVDAALAVDCHLELGNPARRLVEVAERERALLLVVGTSDDAHRPPSIVVRGIARSAPCPVVLVRETAPVPRLDPADDRP
jgi:nucleotide-binding universal stress UspA family protein